MMLMRIIPRDPKRVTKKQVVAPDAILEYEVIINTEIVLGEKSTLRKCTLGNCRVDGPPSCIIEQCLVTEEQDLARLWDMAGMAAAENAGHLAA